MKRSICTILVSSILFAAHVIPGISPVRAGDLPELITFTSYKVGSLGYTVTSGFREAIEQLTPMKVRIEPYGNDFARMLPLKNKESEMAILGGSTGTVASYGILGFSGKEWGPQPLRQVWRGITIPTSAITRGDSGLVSPKDLKGKRVPFVLGSPTIVSEIEAILAFSGLDWNDVVKVPMSGYVDHIKGIMQGTNDVAFVATVTPTVKEVAAGPRGIAYIMTPHNDKEGWKRLQEKAPFLSPHVITKAPGLPEGKHIEGQKMRYNLWAYEHADPEMIYAVVKALHQGHDIFKGMHKVMPGWNIKQATSDPSPVPYHEGAIRYFKEAGVWAPEMDKWQTEQLKSFHKRRADFEKK